EPGRGLCRAREPERRTHLPGDGLGHLLVLRLIGLDDPLQQREAFFAGGFRKCREGTLGGRDGLVDVRGGPKGDSGNRLFGGGIDDREVADFGRSNPLPVDVELSAAWHACPPWGTGAPVPRSDLCSRPARLPPEGSRALSART